jgi:hypothetical protein
MANQILNAVRFYRLASFINSRVHLALRP